MENAGEYYKGAVENQKGYSAIEKVKAFIYMFIIMMGIWLLLTSTFNTQEVIAGIVISLVLTIFLLKYYLNLGLPPLTPKRILFFIIYLFILLIEITKANFDVAYRVLHPALPIKPGVVAIKTELKQDIAKLMLANSITLTPGTFTLDIIGDTLLIHWITVKTENIEEATKKIGRRFEKYLKVIFG